MTNDDAVPPASMRVPDPLVMPFANVRHLGFLDKVGAARLAGFGQLSLHPHEARDTIKSGLRPADMLGIAAENGVALTRLDPLSNWNPRWLPANMDTSYIDGFDIGATEFFELCQQLGITYCSLNATFADDVYPADEVIEHFAATCDLAARHGVTCDLENLPMWGVKTIRQAWSVVSAAAGRTPGSSSTSFTTCAADRPWTCSRRSRATGSTASSSTTARCGCRPG